MPKPSKESKPQEFDPNKPVPRILKNTLQTRLKVAAEQQARFEKIKQARREEEKQARLKKK